VLSLWAGTDSENSAREALLSVRAIPLSLVLIVAALLFGCGLYIGTPAGPGGTLPNPVKTIAGSSVARGSADGVGTAASFSNPQGIVAVGTDLYITDTGNNAIRKLDTLTYTVTTFAAGFHSPHGIASDGTNLYVADTDDCTIRQVDLATGTVTVFAGASGSPGSANGAGGAARFFSPYGIVASGADLYVTDTLNHTLRRIVIAGAVVSTWAGVAGSFGSTNGIGALARFNSPCGITTDGTNLYVSDYLNHTIRQAVIATANVVTPAGQVGVSGSADGTGAAAAFNGPAGLATDGTNLYVADSYNCAIRKVTLGGAVVSTLAGMPGTPGSADGGLYTWDGVYPIPPALMSYPSGVALISGVLYVADSGNNLIRAIQ
jgi:hypothetical protein